MSSPAKALMDVFHDFAMDYKKTGEYDKGFVFDTAESAVNNVMHGRAIKEVLAMVRSTLVSNKEMDFTTPSEAEAYEETLELLDEFAKDYQ